MIDPDYHVKTDNHLNPKKDQDPDPDRRKIKPNPTTPKREQGKTPT